jgi:hypothetical protein
VKSSSKEIIVTTTLEEFVARAKLLRGKFDEAERELLDYLVWAEGQTFWREETGHTDFVQVLEHFSLCKPSRYIAWRDQTAKHGTAARSVSVNALVEANKFTEPAVQRDLIDQAAKWEEANGTPISPQSAATIGRDQRSRQAALVTRGKSYATVTAELENARREIARLTEENKNLRAEMAALKRPLAAKKPATRARAKA